MKSKADASLQVTHQCERQETMSGITRKLAVAPLLAVVFWGYAFSGIATALRAGFQPQSIVALRMVIAAIGFVALYAIGYIRFQPIPLRNWPRLLLLTVVGIFVYHLALVNGQREVPAGIASLIVTSTAIWTYLFSILEGSQKWSWKAGGGLLLSTSGMFLVVSPGGMSSGTPISWYSVSLVLCAPVSLAIYTVLAKPLIRFGASNLTAQIIILAAIGLSAIELASGGLQFSTSANGWIAIVTTGILSTLVAYTLWFRALEKLPAATVAAYSYLTPVFGNSFASLLLGEVVTWRMFAGSVTIVFGLVLIVRATAIMNKS